MTSLAEADLGTFRKAYETNVMAALNLTRLLTPALAEPPLPLGTPVHVVIGHVDARRDILTVRLA